MSDQEKAPYREAEKAASQSRQVALKAWQRKLVMWEIYKEANRLLELLEKGK